MDNDNHGDRGGIQVIARAAAILRSLRGEPNGLSLAEIATRVDLPRSTVQRIVAALAGEDLLAAVSARARVKLGPGLLRLASASDPGTEAIAAPFMQEMARRVDETVDLSVLDGDNVVFVAQVPGTQRLTAVSAVGKRFPLHCTANGKAMLALLSPDQRESMFAARLKRHTPATLTDKASLEAALFQVQATGLAYDLEEHSAGICAVGAAFRDPTGRAYSISIPVPSSRFEAKRLLLERLLTKTVADLLGALSRSTGV